MRFFADKLLASLHRTAKPFQFFLQLRGAPRHRQIKKEKYRPADDIGRKHAAEVLHATSSSWRMTSTSNRSFSRRLRSMMRNAINTCIARTLKKNVAFIV